MSWMFAQPLTERTLCGDGREVVGELAIMNPVSDVYDVLSSQAQVVFGCVHGEASKSTVGGSRKFTVDKPRRHRALIVI